GRALRLRPRQARRERHRPRLVTGAQRAVRGAAAARRRRARTEPCSPAVDPPRQGAVSHHARRPPCPGRLARDGRAGSARDVLPQALRRGPHDSRCPARACRAVPLRHRRAPGGVPRDRADEHGPRPRLVPPPSAALRARARRARAHVGRRRRACAPPRPTMTPGVASWTGTYALPASASPVAIVVRVAGAKGVVSLGPGHAAATPVTVTVRGKRIRFGVPGLPRNVVFDGEERGGALNGSVRQGALRGTFSLHRGANRTVQLLGAYRSSGGAGVAVTEADGLPPTLVEFPSGAVHGIGPS